MSTATRRRPARAHQPAPATFSPAAAKLIEQIQADACAQLLADLSAKDAIVVLHGFDADTKRVWATGSRIEIEDAKGNTLDMWRHHIEPDGWRNSAHMAGYWHPARWYGNQQLVDATGARWRKELSVMVCDDFGDLVQVAE